MDIPQSGELFENDDWDEIFNLKSEFDTSMTPEENTMIGETSTVSTSPKQSGSGRFKPVPKKDVETLASKTTEKTTNDQTKWAVKIFRGIKIHIIVPLSQFSDCLHRIQGYTFSM